MIIVKITGGLGNQLFQYALGRAVANHHQVSFKLDISAYETYKLHNGYRLNQFNIKADIANYVDIINLKGPNNFIYRACKKAGLVKKKTYYAEKQRTIYDPAVFKEGARYLDGYWQNEKYFIEIREALLHEFMPNQPLSVQAQVHQFKIQHSTAVSIHVRRGDYLTHPEIGVLDVEYYKKSVEYIRSRVVSPLFFVFSNDLDWCKEHFIFIENLNYIDDTTTEIDDLILMSQCQHNIIANSSFSWWSAWLNSNASKIVIAPKRWMINNPNNYKWTPNSWIEIE